jgi:hypothetical protein
MMILGLSIFVGYPLLTAAVRKATGNENATIRRGGSMGLAQGAIDTGAWLADKGGAGGGVKVPGTNLELTQGQREFTSELESLLTPAPGLVNLMELGVNTDFYAKKPIYDPRNPGHAAVEIAHHLLGSAPQARDILDMITGRRGPGRVLAEEMLPITLPSEEDVIRHNRGYAAEKKDANSLWNWTVRQLGLQGPPMEPLTRPH